MPAAVGRETLVASLGLVESDWVALSKVDLHSCTSSRVSGSDCAVHF